MNFKTIASTLVSLSTLFVICDHSQAFIPPNTWEITVTKVNNQWTYIVDPAGITQFEGDFYFDSSRLSPLSTQPVGLQGINIRDFYLDNSMYRNLLGETDDPNSASTAVSGDIFQITFDALDDIQTPPSVRWSGTFAKGFDDSDRPVTFTPWDVSFPVPEPGSLLLILCGSAGFLVLRRRDRK